MQKYESYNLLGTRNPGPTAAQIAGLADQMVRGALVEMTTKHRREPTAPSPRRQTPAPRPVSPAFESRPSATVALGGPARLQGRNSLSWALQELRNADPSVLRAEIRCHPESWAAALANLDRLAAQVTARPAC